jgi:hypothetical protein
VAGKNTVLKYRAAAVPKQMKSYVSMVAPHRRADGDSLLRRSPVDGMPPRHFGEVRVSERMRAGHVILRWLRERAWFVDC